MKKIIYLFLFSAVTACVDDTTMEDGIDDTFLDASGKEDTAGVTEGSPAALAVLRVANERTELELKDHGVPKRAAQHIVAARTSGPFTSLAQLDVVPYVGSAAFARLLAYANELGYVDAMPTNGQPPADLWSVAACPRITYSQVLARYPSGTLSVDFGRPYTTASRHRETCNPVTGCTQWQDGGVMLYGFSAPTGFLPSTTRGTASAAGQPSEIRFYFNDRYGDVNHDFGFVCDGLNDATTPPFECFVDSAGGWGAANIDAVAVNTGEPLRIHGNICADGSYHFVSTVSNNQSNDPANLNQITFYGKLF